MMPSSSLEPSSVLEAGDLDGGSRREQGDSHPSQVAMPARGLIVTAVTSPGSPPPVVFLGGPGVRYAESPPPAALAEAALRSRDVRGLADASGYSTRQLRRRLQAATGHGPKRLERIGRMHAVLRAGRGESWARTAAEHGYFDEAHLANDVRDLAGATPHALVG